MALTQVAADWDALTDAQKKALFDVNGVETPLIADMITLGKFTMARYAPMDQQEKVTIAAAPPDQLIIQKDTISLANFYLINSVTITPSLSGAGAQTYAFTPDGNKYYIYSSSEWTEIATESVTIGGTTYKRPTAAAMAAAMNATDVSNVSSAAWMDFKDLGDALGVCYFMTQSVASDTCGVDELAASITVAGKYIGGIVGTDYGFRYETNDALIVSLYANGDYKISYKGVQA